MAKVLLVEDDRQLAENIKEYLEKDGHTIDLAHDGADGIQLACHNKYDLSILDWELPSASGPEICRTIRKTNPGTRVLFLTGRGEINDKLTGFDVGADDYMVKPFQPREFSSRVKALLRRIDTGPEPVLKAIDLELYPGSHKAYKGGKPITLTPKEFALLSHFIKNPGKLFTAKQLLDLIWPGDSDAGVVAVRAHVKNLRKKISDSEDSCPLVNVFGEGYRFDN